MILRFISSKMCFLPVLLTDLSDATGVAFSRVLHVSTLAAEIIVHPLVFLNVRLILFSCSTPETNWGSVRHKDEGIQTLGRGVRCIFIFKEP